MKPGFSKIEGEHSIADDAAAVNPNFAKGAGYQLNCGNCTAAYEMRRRGFDVEAAPRAEMRVEEWKNLFEGFEAQRGGRTTSSVVENITKEALSWGDGARGMVAGTWKEDGGHVFSFEVSDGKVMFVDSQYPRQDVKTFFDKMRPPSIIFGRTDNLKPSGAINSAVIDKRSKK